MALSIRLKQILSMIKPTDRLLDIGTDHALLCIEAINTGLAQYCLAVDNKKEPLQIASKNIEEHQLTNKIHTLLSEGAKQVNELFDTWVIAGLGGETIIEILSDSLEKTQSTKQIVLSPHSKVGLLRQFCYEHGFDIENEKLVFDYKYYVVMSVKYTGQSREFSLYEKEIGLLKNDPLYLKWVKHQKKHYQSLVLKNREFEELNQLFNQEFYRNQSQEMD